MLHDSKHSCPTPSMASGYKVLSFGQVCADQMRSLKTRANKSMHGLVRCARQGQGVNVQRCAGFETILG